MKYDVEISEQADTDLRSIFAYIAYELQSFQNATEQLNRLEKSILSLDEMPERYRRYDKEPWFSRRLRIMPVDNYCAFYIPDASSRIVSIVRIMYSGRDIETELCNNYEPLSEAEK